MVSTYTGQAYTRRQTWYRLLYDKLKYVGQSRRFMKKGLKTRTLVFLHTSIYSWRVYIISYANFSLLLWHYWWAITYVCDTPWTSRTVWEHWYCTDGFVSTRSRGNSSSFNPRHQKTIQCAFEPHHVKTCFCHMRTTKKQISLRIRPVRSLPLLFAAWIV